MQQQDLEVFEAHERWQWPHAAAGMDQCRRLRGLANTNAVGARLQPVYCPSCQTHTVGKTT